MKYRDLILKLIMFAESIRGKIKYNLDYHVDQQEFFRIKFEKDRKDEAKVCKVIF